MFLRYPHPAGGLGAEAGVHRLPVPSLDPSPQWTSPLPRLLSLQRKEPRLGTSSGHRAVRGAPPACLGAGPGKGRPSLTSGPPSRRPVRFTGPSRSWVQRWFSSGRQVRERGSGRQASFRAYGWFCSFRAGPAGGGVPPRSRFSLGHPPSPFLLLRTRHSASLAPLRQVLLWGNCLFGNGSRGGLAASPTWWAMRGEGRAAFAAVPWRTRSGRLGAQKPESELCTGRPWGGGACPHTPSHAGTLASRGSFHHPDHVAPRPPQPSHAPPNLPTPWVGLPLKAPFHGPRESDSSVAMKKSSPVG